MTDKKLSQLPLGSAVTSADLFYSAQSLGAASYTQVQQPASALLTYVATSVSTGGIARTQRLVTGSPTVNPTDQIINCNISSGSPNFALPPSSTRSGVALTIKDVGSQALAHNITITPSGAETIDGMANYVLANNRASVTLTPYNDGTNSGWMIA